MKWKNSMSLAATVVMTAALPLVASAGTVYASTSSNSASGGGQTTQSSSSGTSYASNLSNSGTSTQATTYGSTYSTSATVQIVSGNDFTAGKAATVQLDVSGIDLSASNVQVTLENSVNGTINVTNDATVTGPNSILLQLPEGDAGVGAGTYTITVQSGSSVASTTPGNGLQVLPYTDASTVQWDGIYTSDSSTYVSNPNPAAGQSVTISMRAYSGNLSKVVLNCWDTAANKGFQVDMTPGKTFGPYQLWSATIPASNGGTIYYRFDIYDGSSFACLSGDGLHTYDDTNQNFPLPVGSVSLSEMDANPGDTLTANDPVGDFSGSSSQPNQTMVSFINADGQTVATSQGFNAGWSSVQFTVPQNLPDGLYTVDLDTVAQDADRVVNVSLNRSATLLVGPLPAWMKAYYHDSFNTFYRSPFGAVAAGTPITLRLRGPVDLKSATLRLWGATGQSGELDLPMQPLQMPASQIEQEAGVSQATDYSWWTVTIPASDVQTPGTMWYQFVTQTSSGQTLYYDDNGSQLEGPGAVGFSSNGPSYQISVFEKGFETPDWLKHAVIYEIMPDRFYNGNIATDENPKTQKGIYVNANGQESLGPIEFHQHWSSPPDDPNIPPSSNPSIEKLRGNGQWNIDFFGGDLQGIQDKLDYLKSLGVNTLYLMPVFEAESNHKYDTADFMKIDPGFGTQQDWLNLVKAAHAKGFHIILDGVFEDTGSDSIYFNKFGNFKTTGAWQAYQSNQPSSSPYYSWYEWTGNPQNPYNGWFNIDTLPETNTSNPAYQKFIYSGKNSVAKYWIEQGASGWRLDSADNSNFNTAWWSGFRDAVKSIDPNAAIIGEIWNNATNDNGTDWLTGSTFDSVMNYQFRNAVIDFFRGNYNDGNEQHHAVDAAGFNQRLMRLYSEYPKQSFYAMMNLVDSQDTMRILTILENAPQPSDISALQQDLYQPSAADEQIGIEKLKLVSDLQFGFPGDPTIWYGDEAGLTGYKDPLSRRTYPWNHQNLTLLNHYRKLGAIRKANPVLQTGDFQPLYTQGMVYAFARTIRDGHDVFGDPANDASAIVALNNQNQSTTVSLPTKGTVADGTRLLDELNNQWYTVENGQVTLTLQPYQGAILVTPTRVPVAYLQESGNQNQIAWTPVEGATGYRVFRKNRAGQWQPVGGPLSASTLYLPVERGAYAQTFAVEALFGPGPVLGPGPLVGPPVAPPAGPNVSASMLSSTVDLPALRLTAPVVKGTLLRGQAILNINSVPGATQYVVYEEQADGSYIPVQTVSVPGISQQPGQPPIHPGGPLQPVQPSMSPGNPIYPPGIMPNQPPIRVNLEVPSGTTSVTYRVAAQNEDGQAVTQPFTLTNQ
ncbi:alpha-amylase family glycosyl hydrolase [Alicyclobacillus tolerans]|nr:glycoside hydrolase family 13 protein [Alicyclobacillus montanus]